MSDLEGKKVAIIVYDNYEQVELTGPRDALQAAGVHVDVISTQAGPLQGLHHLDAGDQLQVDVAMQDADFDEYDALVLPGGTFNADMLRMEDEVRLVVADFMDDGKPVAAICHAPWVLISAGVVAGRKLTSYATLQDDIRNAGGEWSDQPVVVDDNLITSRNPDDIPAFNAALIGLLG